jgi:hypothetical protein
MATKGRRNKGVFSRESRLPIAGRYLWPGGRTATLVAGLVGCAVALVALGVARLAGGANPLAPGPVAASHANFERRCAACHAGRGTPAAASCRVCHEKVDDRHGTYSFAAHYAYRNAGGARRTGEAAREVPCAACHPEHRGRQAALTVVADSRCLGCHRFGSFERGHPEFRFAREHVPDDANLRFPHHPHVKAVREKKGYADPQLTCLYCHNPDARGDGFQPIDFDRHCSACHLDSSAGTPRLPVGNPADPRAPGVETLERIQQRRGAGIRWAFFTNPEEFQQAGGKVAKRPVYHQDPWILENLRQIRRTLYPDLGLAELLKTAVDGRAGAGPALSREAVATLREETTGLRGRPEPEVQEELARLDALLAVVEARLRQGEALPASLFAAGRAVDPALTAEQAARLQRLALDLTEPCRKCHVVSGAAILRPQTDQRTLVAAEFSHRTHRIERPLCTDCHDAIPGLGAVAAPRDEHLDVAATQNLPTLAVCRQCHTAAAASNRCVTCHLFHPDRGRYADLVAYQRGT